MSTKINLTDELIAKICSLVEQGRPFDYAFILSGIDKSSGYALRSVGVKDNSKETQEYKLWSSMNESKSKYLSRLVDRMNRLIDLDDDKVDWKAVMTMMERRDPGNYRRDGARHETDAVTSDDQDLNKQIAILISQVNSGALDSDEAAKRADLIKTAAFIKGQTIKIEENGELKNLIDQLEQKLSLLEGTKNG